MRTYTYILECSDKTLYTGWSIDVLERWRCHNLGKGAKYTRARRPCKLVYVEFHTSKHDAMVRECAIKKLSREEKLQLIDSNTNMINKLEGLSKCQ